MSERLNEMATRLNDHTGYFKELGMKMNKKKALPSAAAKTKSGASEKVHIKKTKGEVASDQFSEADAALLIGTRAI